MLEKAFISGKSVFRLTLSALTISVLVGTTAFALARQDQDQSPEKKVEKPDDKQVEKRRTVKVIQSGRKVREIKNGKDGDVIRHEDSHVRAIEDALEEVREALRGVAERLENARGERDRETLEAAKESLERAIEALEEQRENRVYVHRIIDQRRDAERRMIRIERAAVRDALERLDDEAEELMESREEMLDGIEEMREELAEEIEDIQIEIEEGDDRHVVRLRALREAELAVSEMEEHHLAAIKAAEKELQRARARLEKKLREKKERLEQKQRGEQKSADDH